MLAHAGILKGIKATFFESPDSLREIKSGGAVPVNKAVVVDGRIITANGPAAAQEFAGAILSAIKHAGG